MGANPDGGKGPTAAGGQGVCARCRRCCVVAPEDEALVFPLTPGDMARLRAALGHGRWLDHGPNTPEFLAMLQRLFPRAGAALARAFPPGRVHPRLAVGAGGACFFLGPAGCQLPPELRPAHCRLFPVWGLGQRLVPLEADCLAVRESRTLGELLAAVGLDRDQARALYDSLLAAWSLRDEGA